MKQLTAANVQAVFMDCLFRDGEDTTHAKIVEGIVIRLGFHPERLAARKTEIAELLAGLPDEFKADKGDGWSFLNACMTKAGDQWGEQHNVEQLMALGLATEQVALLLPRKLWGLFPGGMPYFVVKS